MRAGRPPVRLRLAQDLMQITRERILAALWTSAGIEAALDRTRCTEFYVAIALRPTGQGCCSHGAVCIVEVRSTERARYSVGCQDLVMLMENEKWNKDVGPTNDQFTHSIAGP